MKLIRYRDGGKIKPGVFHNGKYLGVEGFVDDYNESFFEKGGLETLRFLIREKADFLPEVSQNVELDSPVARPSKIVCIGLNYADHAKETNATIPEEPVIFFKSTTAIIGPDDDVVIPKNSVKTDWEVELALVIGKKASYVDEKDAMDFVAGYMLHNDLSERDFQLNRSGLWDKGKGCDTFAPLGPWLVTPDEVGDVSNLRLWLSVNGKMMQDGNTSNIIFKIPFLVSYISQFMTLLPGDIISTGTPAGVGLGREPQIYLKAGDIMELGIDGLGSSKQKVISFESAMKN
ncbi:MAG: fumarylacetoacetate hydrolase family protein [Chitinophagaceae bacterium]|nr:fumarylacetoacetate hydrolase family protein [Chitinophagaceae bacterium]